LALASDYLGADYYDRENQGPVIILQQPETPIIAPLPLPVRPELHVYSWPESGGDPSTVFTIISKDGATSSAVTVWVQNNTVSFVAPDGTAGQLALGSIDRTATGAANGAKHLTLSLPMESARHR
jgi:hypothetical protein